MPLYQYHCNRHGNYDIFQGMNDEHNAICPVCSKQMRRIFLPAFVKCGNSQIGHTREELFDNLAQEGQADKDWRNIDSYYKHAKGIPIEE